MADYAATANSIYDPQVAAESGQAKTALDSAKGDIAAGKADLQPYYANAFSKLKAGESMAHGTQTMTDNMAGLLDSGLHANQDNSITHQYADENSNLATEQGNKNAAFDRQGANADNSYHSALSSILQKYNGMKASYIADNQSKDADRAFQTKLANDSANLQRELSASSNANSYRIASMNQPAAQTNPSDDFLKYIGGQFQASGGQGNQNTSRQTQDGWANRYFLDKGISNNNDRQQYWDLFNSKYNRNSNASADPRYRK